MTKDVLLSISGLHQDVTGIEAQGDEPGSEPIEVIVPASYYEKNGKLLPQMIHPGSNERVWWKWKESREPSRIK